MSNTKLVRPATFKDRLWEVFDQHRSPSRPQPVFDSRDTVRKALDKSSEQNSIQSIIRPLFGKTGTVSPAIGGHPDFDHLRGTARLERAPVTTMFMDIEKSTRLGILLESEKVYSIKNAFLMLATDVIRAFEGHVHRIMGDAVMAFFGDKKTHPKDAALAAINASSVLMYFVTQSLIPNLDAEFSSDIRFGIRIGLDYGENVLWGSYGYPGMDEVTATSFNVDVASKLQHAAGRNQIMLGASLRELLSIPEELYSLKVSTENGVPQEEPFVRPNLIDADGKPINYRQFLLAWQEYLACTNVAHKDPALLTGEQGMLIELHMHVCDKKDGEQRRNLFPAGNVLRKGEWIRFHVVLLKPLDKVEVRFIVTNHGEDARKRGGPTLGCHETVQTDSFQRYRGEFIQWEHADYSGCHYMTIELRADGRLLLTRRIGVWVE